MGIDKALAAMREKRDSGAIAQANPLRKGMFSTSLRASINAHCYMCMGGDIEDGTTRGTVAGDTEPRKNHLGECLMEVRRIDKQNRRFDEFDHQIIQCALCGRDTTMLATRRCDGCFELESRIKGNPKLARKILSSLDEI